MAFYYIFYDPFEEKGPVQRAAFWRSYCKSSEDGYCHLWVIYCSTAVASDGLGHCLLMSVRYQGVNAALQSSTAKQMGSLVNQITWHKLVWEEWAGKRGEWYR